MAVKREFLQPVRVLPSSFTMDEREVLPAMKSRPWM